MAERAKKYQPKPKIAYKMIHLLDYLLDFACDEKMLELYKRVCRRYLYIYPDCIKSYIEAYWEMWEEKDRE